MTLPRRRFLHLAAGAAALPAFSSIAGAQNYPARPIRLVVPFPPGGAFDALGRPWAEKIKPLLGTVVVENIGGAGASLGAAAVARARPDGYTILLGGTLPHINEALLKSRPLYDPVKDLDPVVSIAANCMSIAVHPAVPAQGFKELIAYAQAERGKLSYGHAGIGSTNHLTGELFKSLTGTPEIVPVSYRGAAPVMTDLIGGQIPMAVVALTGQSLEFHRTGKLRILAVTSPVRLAGAPELPTAAEAGLPGLTVTASLGLLAPAGTPTAIIEQIAGDAHCARRTSLSGDVGGGRFRTDARFQPRKISTGPGGGRCSLDAGCQGAQLEDRLSFSRVPLLRSRSPPRSGLRRCPEVCSSRASRFSIAGASCSRAICVRTVSNINRLSLALAVVTRGGNQSAPGHFETMPRAPFGSTGPEADETGGP